MANPLPWRRACHTLIVCGSVLVHGASILAAASPAPRVEMPLEEGDRKRPLGEEYNRRAGSMVDDGLRYLASVQNEDRSFSIETGEQVTRAPLAVTALSALAFMAGGSTMSRGPYQGQVRDAIRYLSSHMVEKPPPADWAQVDGMPLYFFLESDATSRLHGHGYATLAMAQAYGTATLDAAFRDSSSAHAKAREDREALRSALAGAVLLIEATQVKVEDDAGGWFYDPYDTNHEGSVTVTMIQALRAARNVGIDVDKVVIDRAVRYLHKSQSATGGFRYHLNDMRVSWALTAAAISTLNATGDYDSKIIDLGMDFMSTRDPLLNPNKRASEDSTFPYYGRLYAAQAYYVYRDPAVWDRWQKALLDDLENRQDKGTGAFHGSDYGKPYATAISCLVLQLPYQYLPIFQK